MPQNLEQKVLLIGERSQSLFQLVEPELAEAGLQVKSEEAALGTFSKESLKTIKNFPFSLVTGESALEITPLVQRRSVGSHFLRYVDFISCEKGELWGANLFSQVFKEILLSSIQNQDFKGPVIFLGHSSLALPIIQVLAGFGFEDFVFLKHANTDYDFTQFQAKATGLLNTTISMVDSTAFIQSQKEYSFCFVMEREYSQQTLEDMSYFHFLSTKSIVFDLSGESNFLFKEVKALGVTVSEFEPIVKVWGRVIAEAIKENTSF